MRVQIQDIPPEGRPVVEALTREWVDKALGEIARGGASGGDVDLVIEKVGDKVLIRGQCTADVRLECSRCLNTVDNQFLFPFTHVLEPRPEPGAWEEDVELNEEDLNVSFIEGPEFELDDVIREHLLLEIPMISLCGKECKGLCPMCGIDLNQGSCECAEPVDSRWSALNNFKL